MKKRIVAMLMASMMAFPFAGCGEKTEQEKPSQENAKEEDSKDKTNPITVDKNLLTTELTIPADYIGETTQEELDQTAKEHGIKSITLNQDGSATYVMTKAAYKKYLEELRTSLQDSLQEMAGSEEYPNFKEVTANEDFTKFTIKTSSTTLDMTESFSVMAFYMYGGLYNAFAGKTPDNIHVDFVNADSGELIESADSSSADSYSEEESSSMTFSDTDGIIDMETKNYKFTFTKFQKATDYEGKPCLLFYYNFTNNSTDNACASCESNIQCFQNGVECDSAYPEDIPEYENSMKDIQPGTTLEVCECFALSDDSDVTIEAVDYYSMDSSKDTQIISLK